MIPAPRRLFLSSRDAFGEHERTIVAVVSHMNADDLLAFVKEPAARVLLFTDWPIIADDYSKVFHCLLSFLNSPRDRLNHRYFATQAADGSVLAQNAIGDVF